MGGQVLKYLKDRVRCAGAQFQEAEPRDAPSSCKDRKLVRPTSFPEARTVLLRVTDPSRAWRSGSWNATSGTKQWFEF